MIKNLFCIILLTATLQVQAQYYLGLNIAGTYTPAPKGSKVYNGMNGIIGLDLSKKIALDKALSIGLQFNSIGFMFKSSWVEGNDFTTLAHDKGYQGNMPNADHIVFRYLNVPIGISRYSSLIKFKYQVGFNFLINKPSFALNTSEKEKIPFEFESATPIVVDNSLLVGISVYGMVDLYVGGTYYISPLLKQIAYSYKSMEMVNYKHLYQITVGMSWSLRKFKKKKVRI